MRLVAVTVLLLSLTGCAQLGCTSYAETPSDVVSGMLRDLPKATTPADLCEYVSHGFAVSDAEFDELKSEVADWPDGDLTFVEGEQMAATIVVDVFVDGVTVGRFTTEGDDHNSHWTIDLGHVGGVTVQVQSTTSKQRLR